MYFLLALSRYIYTFLTEKDDNNFVFFDRSIIDAVSQTFSKEGILKMLQENFDTISGCLCSLHGKYTSLILRDVIPLKMP